MASPQLQPVPAADASELDPLPTLRRLARWMVEMDARILARLPANQGICAICGMTLPMTSEPSEHCGVAVVRGRAPTPADPADDERR